MSAPNAPQPADTPRDPGERLTEPSPVSSSPEGEWPFPAKAAHPDASPGPDVGEPAADDPEDGGLVDPRPETAGPEIIQR